MKSHRLVALAVAFALSNVAATALIAAGQQNATLAGTAKDEAKKPFPENTVRARSVTQGTIAGTATLTVDGNFSLPDLSPAQYLVELVNKSGKVVCTEGPFDMSQTPLKNDVTIDCQKVPLKYLLLGAAAAAGVTAGVVAGNASPSQ